MTDEHPQSFEALVRPEIDTLYRFAFRLTGDRDDAEDLVQDVLVKVYGRRDELSSIEVLRPWLCRVLYNQFVDDERRYRRRRLSVVKPADDPARAGDPMDAYASSSASPEQLSSRAFDIKQLEAALAELSPEHRAVLLMHDSEGYKLAEIQVITGIPVGTLKSRIHRARARLRERLAEPGTF